MVNTAKSFQQTQKYSRRHCNASHFYRHRHCQMLMHLLECKICGLCQVECCPNKTQYGHLCQVWTVDAKIRLHETVHVQEQPQTASIQIKYLLNKIKFIGLHVLSLDILHVKHVKKKLGIKICHDLAAYANKQMNTEQKLCSPMSGEL